MLSVFMHINRVLPFGWLPETSIRVMLFSGAALKRPFLRSPMEEPHRVPIERAAIAPRMRPPAAKHITRSFAPLNAPGLFANGTAFFHRAGLRLALSQRFTIKVIIWRGRRGGALCWWRNLLKSGFLVHPWSMR